MAETIVDTSIFNDFLRGRAEARQYLKALQAAGDLTTRTVVVAETLSGARDLREQREIERLFRLLRIHAINEADAALSLDLLRRHRLSHGVGWLDCLIAATCQRIGLVLASLNEKHFAPFEGLTVQRPY